LPARQDVELAVVEPTEAAAVLADDGPVATVANDVDPRHGCAVVSDDEPLAAGVEMSEGVREHEWPAIWLRRAASRTHAATRCRCNRLHHSVTRLYRFVKRGAGGHFFKGLSGGHRVQKTNGAAAWPPRRVKITSV